MKEKVEAGRAQQTGAVSPMGADAAVATIPEETVASEDASVGSHGEGKSLTVTDGEETAETRTVPDLPPVEATEEAPPVPNPPKATDQASVESETPPKKSESPSDHASLDTGTRDTVPGSLPPLPPSPRMTTKSGSQLLLQRAIGHDIEPVFTSLDGNEEGVVLFHIFYWRRGGVVVLS